MLNSLRETINGEMQEQKLQFVVLKNKMRQSK
jgi:hypothetical protein